MLLLFHDNNGCANAPHCYAIHTLPLLLILPSSLGLNVQVVFPRRVSTRTWYAFLLFARTCCVFHSSHSFWFRHPHIGQIRGGADKSLARPGMKQVTATKLGIYSSYSLRSSLHFLARCSNFRKPLKRKKSKVVRPTRSSRQQWPPRRTKNGDLSCFFSPGNRW